MPQDLGLHDPLLLNEWFAVAWTSSLPVKKLESVRVLGRDLVLWRSKEGLHAWQDLCVHRGAKLSLGRITQEKDCECVVCPYHGWEYNSSGACVRIPAHPDQAPPSRARVEAFSVREKYGLAWVCLGKPVGEVPSFPEGVLPGFRLISTGPYRFHAQGPRIIENILDLAHLPIAHAGMLGDPAKAEIGEYTVSTSPEGIVARDIPIWQPDPDGTGRPAKVHYTFWVERPFTTRLTKTHPSQHFAILGTVTPIDAESSLAWIVLALNYAHDVPEQELRTFQDRVTEQDIRIVNSQRPELLPLDLQSELHLRSDQIAIAYRRWLKQLGLQYGTS
ncbi:MAG TPA: aromatic ring-hydroxylating dioxygenase subunit alpha [Candidatus Acidoferrales bacterium]|nr:aromatic ring-hydroxylating dioxygenase subunit alpha [Candidatus Acidoferrales bacterium]